MIRRESESEFQAAEQPGAHKDSKTAHAAVDLGLPEVEWPHNVSRD